MTDNRTNELREKLDSLGIEHFDYDKGGRTQTQWEAPDGKRHFTYETSDNPAKTARLVIAWYPTPEQAIAATLGNHPTKSGRGYYTDRDGEGTHIMCDDCGGYIGTAEEIAATLGSDFKSMRTFDSMETALSIAEKEVEIEKLQRENDELCKENEELTHRRAELEAVALGSERHAYEQRITGDGSDWGEIMRDAYDDLMASACESCTPEQMGQLADYIRAELGSGTCEPKWTLQGKTQTQEFWRCECGNCGYEFGVEDRQSFPWHVVVGSVDVPNFCPECGVKQKAVSR